MSKSISGVVLSLSLNTALLCPTCCLRGIMMPPYTFIMRVNNVYGGIIMPRKQHVGQVTDIFEVESAGLGDEQYDKQDRHVLPTIWT